MNDLLRGWKMACRMALEEADRFAEFNEEEWDIHVKKGREIPHNLKELDKLLWKAFRAGQAYVGASIASHIRYRDWSKYDEPASTRDPIG